MSFGAAVAHGSLVWFALPVSQLLCNCFGAYWPSVFGVWVAPLAFAADGLDAFELFDCKCRQGHGVRFAILAVFAGNEPDACF
ncbi:hypothetical protein D9M69_655660 [compost metagenome]